MPIPLKQSTAIDVRVGPFVDVGDGFTPEIGVTIAASDQAEILKADGAATVAMTGVFAAISACDGWYDYTMATTDVDVVGELVVVMQDASVYLPVFMRFYVVEEAVYDALYGAASEGPLQGTTAGNKLDVAATGEAGVDFGNILGTLDAAQIGADAITAAKVAADVHAEAADAVWDEDIVAAHGAASAAGLLVRALGATISARSNNPTLDALLGIADVAGKDMAEQLLRTEVMAELGVAVPDATPTVEKLLMLLYMSLRNKATSTTTLLKLFNDADAAIVDATIAEAAGTLTRSEMVAGT